MNDNIDNHGIVLFPKMMYVIWHPHLGIRRIGKSDFVKKHCREQGNRTTRYYEFTFDMGLEHEIVSPSGRHLHLNSIGLYQILMYHRAYVSKNHTFKPERDLKHYFDKNQVWHNLALNWYEYVLPQLSRDMELNDIYGSTVRYSVGQEREMRGWIWDSWLKHPY